MIARSHHGVGPCRKIQAQRRKPYGDDCGNRSVCEHTFVRIIPLLIVCARLGDGTHWYTLVGSGGWPRTACITLPSF